MRRRPPHLRFAAIVLVAVIAAAPARSAAGEDAGYVAGVADVPLMPGLREVPGHSLVFDKPGGRLVEAVAVGSVDRAEVTAFYTATLPQLGWLLTSELSFIREEEGLTIVLEPGVGPLTVRFSIRPR